MEKSIDINNIDDVVEFLNDGLAQGKKVTSLRKELSMGEKKLQKGLKSNGYSYSQKLKKYIKDSNVTTEVIIQNDCKSSTADVVTQSDCNMTTNMPREFFEAINKMNDMSSKFENMYNWYEMQTKVIDVPDKPNLKIMPNDNVTVTRSMRLYLDTYERFTAFTKANKDKRVQDILDSALREFLDRYEDR